MDPTEALCWFCPPTTRNFSSFSGICGWGYQERVRWREALRSTWVDTDGKRLHESGGVLLAISAVLFSQSLPGYLNTENVRYGSVPRCSLIGVPNWQMPCVLARGKSTKAKPTTFFFLAISFHFLVTRRPHTENPVLCWPANIEL